uniref:Uncharacterized protein n=1 Tax=Siphoviridae sp. ctj912 TaxID=2827920 RepID=A0A8S5SNI8_9CAUD|nr:MAG TPA: hypothetical protein [Siphoviridae sp. ctj912]
MPGPARRRVAGPGAPKREKVGTQADRVPGHPRRHVGRT